MTALVVYLSIHKQLVAHELLLSEHAIHLKYIKLEQINASLDGIIPSTAPDKSYTLLN